MTRHSAPKMAPDPGRLPDRPVAARPRLAGWRAHGGLHPVRALGQRLRHRWQAAHHRARRALLRALSRVAPVAMRAHSYKARHGYVPCFARPVSFTEKIHARILYQQDPYYLLYANKLFAPYYATGKTRRTLKFAKRLKVLKHLEPGAFHDLPDQFVIKSSFASNLLRLAFDKSTLDVAATCARFNAIVRTAKNAKGVNFSDNCIIIEELLLSNDGRIPTDYKFHCFRKDQESFDYIVQIDESRFGNHQQTFIDHNRNILDLKFGNKRPENPQIDLPNNFNEMISIARDLSDGFSYIRVDLYSISENTYFGEFTPYHQGGLLPVIPRDWDYILGEMWNFDESPAWVGRDCFRY